MSSVVYVAKRVKMAITIVLQWLLAKRYCIVVTFTAHCSGSMCMFPLIHSDLRMSPVFPEVSSKYYISRTFTTLCTTFSVSAKGLEANVGGISVIAEFADFKSKCCYTYLCSFSLGPVQATCVLQSWTLCTTLLSTILQFFKGIFVRIS